MPETATARLNPRSEAARKASKPIVLRLSPEQKKRADTWARYLGEGLGTLARLALVEYLDKLDEKDRRDREAKQAARKGAFVPDIETDWQEEGKKTAKKKRPAIPLPAEIAVTGDLPDE